MVKNWCIAFMVLAVSGSVIVQAKQRDVPLPRLKPKDFRQAADEAPAAPAKIVLNFPTPTADDNGWPKDVVTGERKECVERLKGAKMVFEAMAPFGQSGGCGAAAALKVSSIAGVAIQPAGEFTCDMAEQLHGWISNSVLPAAQHHLEKRLVKINNASAYVCRRRNNQATGKLSEHAKANALDIATLGFDDGSSVSIKGDWSGLKQLIGVSEQGNFLRTIRRDACLRFTTVLGPGSDPFHGDHFHIDVARRKNGYRICN